MQFRLAIAPAPERQLRVVSIKPILSIYSTYLVHLFDQFGPCIGEEEEEGHLADEAEEGIRQKVQFRLAVSPAPERRLGVVYEHLL